MARARWCSYEAQDTCKYLRRAAALSKYSLSHMWSRTSPPPLLYSYLSSCAYFRYIIFWRSAVVRGWLQRAIKNLREKRSLWFMENKVRTCQSTKKRKEIHKIWSKGIMWNFLNNIVVIHSAWLMNWRAVNQKQVFVYSKRTIYFIPIKVRKILIQLNKKAFQLCQKVSIFHPNRQIIKRTKISRLQNKIIPKL